MVMEFEPFVRRPFRVEAIEITLENMSEIAELIGDVRTKDGTTFIAIDRRIVPNVNRAFAGWWMTRLNDNYRCYNPKVFREQFIHQVEVLAFNFPADEPEDDDFEYDYVPEGEVEPAAAE